MNKWADRWLALGCLVSKRKKTKRLSETTATATNETKLWSRSVSEWAYIIYMRPFRHNNRLVRPTFWQQNIFQWIAQLSIDFSFVFCFFFSFFFQYMNAFLLQAHAHVRHLTLRELGFVRLHQANGQKKMVGNIVEDRLIKLFQFYFIRCALWNLDDFPCTLKQTLHTSTQAHTSYSLVHIGFFQLATWNTYKRLGLLVNPPANRNFSFYITNARFKNRRQENKMNVSESRKKNNIKSGRRKKKNRSVDGWWIVNWKSSLRWVQTRTMSKLDC